MESETLTDAELQARQTYSRVVTLDPIECECEWCVHEPRRLGLLIMDVQIHPTRSQTFTNRVYELHRQ